MKDRGTAAAPADSVASSGISQLHEVNVGPDVVVPVKGTEPEPEKLGKRTVKALSELDAAEAKVTRWTEAADMKRLQVRDLEARMGSVLFEAADEEQAAVAGRLTAELVQLRTGAELDDRAVATAELLVVDAKRAVFAAEVADLRDHLRDARRAYDQHTAKTTKLLEELRVLDGVDYTVPVPQVESGSVGVFGTKTRTTDLRMRVLELEARIALLGLAAAGRPLPKIARTTPIPHRLYSRRIRALRPDLLNSRDADTFLSLVDPSVMSRQSVEEFETYLMMGGA